MASALNVGAHWFAGELPEESTHLRVVGLNRSGVKHRTLRSSLLLGSRFRNNDFCNAAPMKRLVVESY